MSKDSFGDRMKFYEGFESERRLMPLLPAYARMDGICFHNFCQDLTKPYDQRLSDVMLHVTLDLAKAFNAHCAYTQSDEISLGWNIDDYQNEMFCDGKILKLNSHLASKATLQFNKLLPRFIPEKVNSGACFDARVMNLPNLTEASNMFLWREQDATRNSIQMAGHAKFSQKQMHGKNCSQIQEMLWQKENINWNDYPSFFKRGTFYIRRKVMREPDLSRVPEKHRHKQVGPVEKSEFVYCEMPSFSKVTNREGVLFREEEPVIKTEL
jgi:tRNA(His) guanylyltransferase